MRPHLVAAAITAFCVSVYPAGKAYAAQTSPQPQFSLGYPVPESVKAVLKVMNAIDRRDREMVTQGHYTLEIQQAFRGVLGFEESGKVPEPTDFQAVRKYHLSFLAKDEYETKGWGVRQLRACAGDDADFLSPWDIDPLYKPVITVIRRYMKTPFCGHDAMLSSILRQSAAGVPLPPQLDQYVFLTLLGCAARETLSAIHVGIAAQSNAFAHDTHLTERIYNYLHEITDDPHAYAVDYVLGFARRYGLLEG